MKQKFFPFLSILGLTIILAAVFAAPAGAGAKDTVGGLQAAATEGIADTADFKELVDEVHAVLSQVTANSTYRNSFVTYMTAKDSASLLAEVRQRATRSTVSVDKIEPSILSLRFVSRKGKVMTLCVSGGRDCGGSSSSVSLK